MTALRFYMHVLCFFLMVAGVPGLCTADAVASVDKHALVDILDDERDLSVEDMTSQPQIGWEDFMGLIELLRKEHFDRAAAKRQEMFDLIKKVQDNKQQSLDQNVLEVTEDYARLVSLLNFNDLLKSQVVKVLLVLKQDPGVVASKEATIALISELESLYAALDNGSFAQMLKGASSDAAAGFSAMPMNVAFAGGLSDLFYGSSVGSQQNGASKNVEAFTSEKLQKIASSLSEFIVVPVSGYQGFLDDLDLLKRFVFAIESRKQYSVAVVALEVVKPYFVSLVAAMQQLLERLENAKALNLHVTERQAVEYWIDELTKNNVTLKTFDSLQKNARLQPSYDFHNFFKLAASAYDVSMMLVDFNRKDFAWADQSIKNYNRVATIHNNTVDTIKAANPSFDGIDAMPLQPELGIFHQRFYLPIVLDYAMRVSLAGWCFNNASAENKTEMLYNTLAGDLKLTGLRSSHVQLFTLMSLPVMGPSLLGHPNLLYRKSKLVTSVMRVGAAYAYYQLFYSYLFNKNASLHHGVPENDVHSWWPRHDEHLLHSMAGLAVHGIDAFSEILAAEMRRSLPPQVLQKVEQYTLHLIRPEAIQVVLRGILPILLLEPTYDVEKHFGAGIGQYFGDFKEYHLIEPRVRAFAVEHDADARLCYLELTAVSYVASSLGMHAGRAFARRYTNAIVAAMGSSVDMSMKFFNGVGLVSDDWFDEYKSFKQDLAEELKENLALIKSIIKGFFNPQSSFRKSIMDFLIEHDYLHKDEKDPLRVNQAIIYMLYYQMAAYRVISYVKASEFITKYEDDPMSLDGIIDATMQEIGANMVTLGGGYVGSFFAEFIAREVYLGGSLHVPYWYNSKDGVAWAGGKYNGCGPLYKKQSN